jgi:hypothetical protein
MSNFFKRWSTLKSSQTQTEHIELSTQDTPLLEEKAKELKTPIDNHAIEQGPSLDDVAKLSKDSDFSLFVQQDVSDEVHHAAMKKLFSDPHYNVMDGLDIYIDDYSKEDPLPAGMLEKMVQSTMLGIFNKVIEPDPGSQEIEPIKEIANQDLDKLTLEKSLLENHLSSLNQSTLPKDSKDDSDSHL